MVGERLYDQHNQYFSKIHACSLVWDENYTVKRIGGMGLRFLGTKISPKLFVLSAVPILLFILATVFYTIPKARDDIYTARKQQSRELGEVGYSIIAHYYALEQDNTLSREEAQLAAAETLRSIRFGERMEDYYWINNYDPVMVMHPFTPELEGRCLENIQDPEGVYLFREFVDIAQEQGEGHVEYHWQYYDHAERVEPKISYVIGFEPWGWIVGTGIYAENIAPLVLERTLTLLGFIAGVTLLALVITRKIAHSLVVRPLNSLVKKAEAIGNGQLEEKVEVRSADEIGQMGFAFNKMAGSINSLVGELKEAHRRLDDIIEFSPDATLVVNDRGIVIAWNKAMEEMTYVPKAEMIGKGNYEYAVPFYGRRQPILLDLALLDEEEFARIKDHYDFIQWNGDTLFGEVYCPETYGGKGAYLWASASRLRDASGTVVGAVESIRDVTDRKLAEEKIDSYTRELKMKGMELEQLYQQLDQELDKARKVHEQTLPKYIPQVQGISLAAHYQPAAKVGGDFYDVLKKGNKLVLYLSDVMGHGLDSALLSVFVKNTINSYVSLTSVDQLTPGVVMEHLFQQYSREDYPQDYFISVFLAVLDLQTQVISYTGAGFQNAPLVIMGSGEQTTLASEGPPLSSALPREILDFQENSLQLDRGSTILFSTDGLFEIEVDGVMYQKQAEKVFYEYAFLLPKEIVRAINDDFFSFNKGSLQIDDDITYLVLQVGAEES